MFDSFISQLTSIGAAEIGILMSIIVMDAALSGDNSIAITAMTKHLPDKTRQKAIYIGMVLAALLRFVALFFTAFIIKNPWVQMLGAGYLIWLCVSHFRNQADEEEGFAHRNKGFVATLVAIGFLDLSLSLDNVIAITAMTKNMAVIIIGVALSIAMLAVATKVTAWLMKRYPSIQDAAYVILGFLGITMFLGHTGEFLTWLNSILSRHTESLHHFKIEIGEIGEIIGVAIILGFALLKDTFWKNSENKEK